MDQVVVGGVDINGKHILLLRSTFQPYFLLTAVVMTEVTAEGVTGKTEGHPEVAEVAAEEEVVVGTPTMTTVTTAVMIGIVTVDEEVDTMMTMVVAVVVEEEAEGEVMEVEGAMVAIETITVVVMEDMALQDLRDLQDPQDLQRYLVMDQAQLVAMDHPLQSQLQFLR